MTPLGWLGCKTSTQTQKYFEEEKVKIDFMFSHNQQLNLADIWDYCTMKAYFKVRNIKLQIIQ